MDNHTLRKATHTLTFWKDGVAVGAMDATDKVELKVGGHFPVFEFESSQCRECAMLEQALAKAYDAGKKARSKEIRDLIGDQ